MPFTSLSSLIPLARMFSAMLNDSGEGGHSCPVSDVRGKALFSPLTMMIIEGLS